MIPDSFQLGAHTIKVQRDAKMKDAYGLWYEQKKLIKLAKSKPDWSEHFALQVFWHEACHAILEHIGRGDLSQDEHFVDGLSEALTQLALTRKD